MRIKIIGDNNCARATRHLLRKAGFAVTEFLPANVVTQAPHSGYVITIDLAPAPQPPDPTNKPDHPTHGPTATVIEEASTFMEVSGGASSPTLHGSAGTLPAGLHAGHTESRRRDAGATRGPSIHFDSVDSELEAAILRHVTQLAAAPVVVDRPGGEVHSERELRIVVPNSGDAKADEAAAVAVEFGVLRGLLDLASPPSLPKMRGASAGLPAGAAGGLRSAGAKKWWAFFLLAAYVGLAFAVGCSATSGFSDNAAFLSGSTAINNFSVVFNDSIAAFTSGNAGALRTTPERMLYVHVGKLGRAALSGAHVVAGGNTSFHLYCVVGCTASAGFTHDVAFATGTASDDNSGGNYDDGRAALSPTKAATAFLMACCRVYASAKVMPIEAALSVKARNVDRASFLPAAALAAQGQFVTGQAPVKITDGTNTLVVDPCKGQTKLYVSINQTANTQLVAGTASKKIYICSIHVVVAVATNAALVEGTGSVCATGTAGVSGFGGATAATGWNFAANGGIALGNGDAAVGAEGTNADNLCLFNSGSGQVSGGISYVVQ